LEFLVDARLLEGELVTERFFEGVEFDGTARFAGAEGGRRGAFGVCLQASGVEALLGPLAALAERGLGLLILTFGVEWEEADWARLALDGRRGESEVLSCLFCWVEEALPSPVMGLAERGLGMWILGEDWLEAD
jgi:hypothetical protein